MAEYGKHLKNPEYWEERLKERFRKVDDYETELTRIYSSAYADIYKDYVKLTEGFLKIDGTVDYAKFESALRYNPKINRTSARYQALLERIERIVNDIGKGEVSSIEQLLMNVYKENYYDVLWHTETGLGYKTEFALLSPKRLKQVVHTAWSADGKEFSSRIWDNKSKLTKELRILIQDGIAKGRSPLQTANMLQKTMGGKLYCSKRIIRTETMAMITDSDCAAYKEIGFEKYTILAAFDKRTSKVCQDMDGRVFELHTMQLGENAPPFHPNCRSTTEPLMFETTRIRYAKDVDNKRVAVPTNMTYAEFQAKHLIPKN